MAENPAATSATTYTFTDTGHRAGRRARLGPGLPDGHQPRHRLLQRGRQLGAGDQHHGGLSIEQEIGLDQAWAAANGLTNYTPGRGRDR